MTSSPTTGATMKALRVHDFGGPANTALVDVPVPTPGVGQVLIRVQASAVQPVDVQTREGLLHTAGLHADRLPVALGWDVAGIVQDVGDAVHRIRPGQQAVALSDRLDDHSKTHAEYVVLDESCVAAVPPGIDPATWAMLPLNGLTALQALEAGSKRAGMSVLVTGAAGAVGSLVTQLGLLEGLRMLGTGRAHQRAHIEALGASFVEIAEVGTLPRQLVAGGADVVVDCAGLGVEALDAVRNQGSFVSLSVMTRPAPLRGIRSASIAIRADWRQLTLLVGLVTVGALSLPAPTVLPLEDAGHAYELLEAGSVRHIALTPSRNTQPMVAYARSVG